MEVDEDGHAQWGHMLNTHLYWNYQSREPNLNYYMLARRQSHMTDGTWRIGMAAAQLAGSANAVTTRPSAPAGERPNDWDEITNAGQGPGWLGAPKGDLVRMGLDEEDILGGIDEDLLERIAMENGEVEIADGCIRLEGDESKRRFFMNVQDVEFEGRDLIVTLHATGEKMAGYPEEGKRLAWLTHMQGGEPISDAGAWGTHQRRHSYFLDDDYVTVFYYPDMPEEGAVDLKFEFEGSEPVSIDELRIIPAVDACYREFENGVVLVNPGKQPYTFNLAELFPGRRFHRIAGRPDQCPEINTGEPVGDTVELPVHDALFLVAD
jgi:hypothetical protein